MTTDRMKLLGTSEVIRSKLDAIIEAFVTFYGEDRREEIENRLRSILIIKFCSPKSLEENIKKIKEGLLKDLLNIDDKKYIHIKMEELIEILETGKKCYFSSSDQETIIGEIIPNEEIHKRYKEGKYPQLEEFVKRFKEIQPILKPYEDFVAEENKKQKEIEMKYYDKLVEEFSYLIPEKDLESYKKRKYTLGSMPDFFGYSMKRKDNCFDDESEQILNTKEPSSWQVQSILDDRVRLLKKLGFEPNNKNENITEEPTYEDFLKDEKCLEQIKK